MGAAGFTATAAAAELVCGSRLHSTLKVGPGSLLFSGSLALLLHTGAISGWRQYAGPLASLPPRLLGPAAPGLPVVIHSVVKEGEVVCVRAAHYPPLRRLLDVYRG